MRGKNPCFTILFKGHILHPDLHPGVIGPYGITKFGIILGKIPQGKIIWNRNTFLKCKQLKPT